jgi:hypothetical protein
MKQSSDDPMTTMNCIGTRRGCVVCDIRYQAARQLLMRMPWTATDEHIQGTAWHVNLNVNYITGVSVCK